MSWVYVPGLAGLELGIRIAVPGARGVAYVEREAHAAANLVARMEDGCLHHAPVWSDLATFDARGWRGVVDCVASGDPCQPNSVAGRGLGAADERFLIDQVLRIVAECGPDRLFRENVCGNADGQLGALVPALEGMGYRVAAGIFSAAEAGASHRRERLFIMADRSGAGRQQEPGGASGDEGADEGRAAQHGDQLAGHGENLGDAAGSRPFPGTHPGTSGEDEGAGARHAQSERRGEPMAHPERHLETWREPRPGETQGWRPCGEPRGSGRALAASDHGGRWPQGDSEISAAAALQCGIGVAAILCAPGPTDARWRQILGYAPQLEPAVCRMADGLANRVDRLRATGNGVFPLAAAFAWCALDALHADADRAGGSVRCVTA